MKINRNGFWGSLAYKTISLIVWTVGFFASWVSPSKASTTAAGTKCGCSLSTTGGSRFDFVTFTAASGKKCDSYNGKVTYKYNNTVKSGELYKCRTMSGSGGTPITIITPPPTNTK